LVFISLLYFFVSLDVDLNLKRYLSDLLKILLILSAILLSVLTFRDVRRRKKEEKKRQKLIKILDQQKKLLRKKFSSSTLNFALDENFPDQPSAPSFPLIRAEDDRNNKKNAKDNPALTQDTINRNGGNERPDFQKVIVEGEDISSFPPEWQKFLRETEGKSAIERLNKMLE